MITQHLKNTHYIRWLPFLAAVLFWGSACTHIKPVPLSEGSTAYTLDLPWKKPAPNDSSASSYYVIGKASWYGRQFHRRRTASGERFNMNAHTAAHRTLPFGTKLLVTNLNNGKSVVVKVNDRGPRSRRWVIDLSYASAKKIGIRGSMDVEVQSLSGRSVSKRTTPNACDVCETYSLQVGSFQDREKAESLYTELGKLFTPVHLVSENGMFKVRVGLFDDPEQARLLKEDLANKGYPVFTVKETPATVALLDKKTAQSSHP